MHGPFAVSGLYQPFSHSSHESVPTALWPRTHSQLAWFTLAGADALKALHATHSAMALPAPSLWVSARHASQALPPPCTLIAGPWYPALQTKLMRSAVNECAGTASQLPPPPTGIFLYLPASHCTHVVPGAPSNPALHWHAVTAVLCTGAYEAAGHELQPGGRGSTRAAHVKGSGTDKGENVMAKHGPVPDVDLKVPAAQETQVQLKVACGGSPMPHVPVHGMHTESLKWLHAEGLCHETHDGVVQGEHGPVPDTSL